jgi:hypothetical protein
MTNDPEQAERVADGSTPAWLRTSSAQTVPSCRSAASNAQLLWRELGCYGADDRQQETNPQRLSRKDDAPGSAKALGRRRSADSRHTTFNEPASTNVGRMGDPAESTKDTAPEAVTAGSIRSVVAAALRS